MRYLFIIFIPIISCLTCAQPAVELSLYKETDRFKIFCTPIDHAVADEILYETEIFLNQLEPDFKHVYNACMEFYIYPDLASFHQAINQPDAPDWIIGKTKLHTRISVSPGNPGPDHSYDSVMRAHKAGVVMLVINDKYHVSIPRWLRQGVGLYKGQFFSPKQVKSLAHNTTLLPTIEQLEAVGNDTMAFDKLNGFLVSYALILFIDQTWGWDAVLQLLQDYNQFESIFNMSKMQFQQQWVEFIMNLDSATRVI